MSSKDIDKSQGDHHYSNFVLFLRKVLEPMKRHPDAYVYLACFAIGAAGAALSVVVAAVQKTDSQFIQSGSFYFLIAGVVCALGWAFRPRRGDLKELQQLRNSNVELKYWLPRMVSEHLLRHRKHAAIFYERDLKNVTEDDRDGRLQAYATKYYDRWHYINNVLFVGKREPGARGER